MYENQNNNSNQCMEVLVSINNEKYPFEGNRRVKYP